MAATTPPTQRPRQGAAGISDALSVSLTIGRLATCCAISRCIVRCAGMIVGTMSRFGGGCDERPLQPNDEQAMARGVPDLPRGIQLR
jgi:hypothetical protein